MVDGFKLWNLNVRAMFRGVSG